MKQRILALLLLAALLLGGCGAEQPAEAPTEAPAAVPTASPPPAPTATPVPGPTAVDPEERFPYDYTELLADTEDFALSVTALGVDREENWVVHLRLENRCDEIMNFRFLFQSINGLAIDDELTYRVAVGGVLEPSFRILREEMAAWGFEKPVQWSFVLKVYSAESNREPCFFEELSASPFGPKSAVRYEFVPGPMDYVALDNDYVTVYITGWKPEDGVLNIEYVAVSRCDRPLLLTLPEGQVLLDGRAYPVELRDGFGAFATLMGYIPVEGWTGDYSPEKIEMHLGLADPLENSELPLEEPELEGEEITIIPENEIEIVS